MLKNALITSILIILFAFVACAQIPAIKENTTENEKNSSTIYKNFSNQYDLLIAYVEESYWWSDRISYRLLAFKNGVCSKGYFYSKRNKHGKWSNPKMGFKKANSDSANYLVKHLNSAGFYTLNRDTLNINTKQLGNGKEELFSLSDGVNYKFEILSKGNLAIIESYEPQYFLEKLPELKARETFINCRDWFLSKYKTL